MKSKIIMIKDLSKTALNEIVDCLHLAFSDYSVPMNASPEYWKNRWMAASIDYKLSFGYFDKNKLAGFLLHGIDEMDGIRYFFNMGTGVIPSHRGMRLVQKLYDHGIPVLAEKGIRMGQLEVITTNVKAIKAYRNVGFEITKTLRCFNGKLIAHKHTFAERRKEKFEIEKYASLQNHYQSWEQNNRTIKRCPNQFTAIELYDDKLLTAYAIIKKAKGNVAQFGVKDGLWEIYGLPLFSAIARISPQYRMLNIDMNDEKVIHFLTQNKFPHLLDQYEMKLDMASLSANKRHSIRQDI